MVSEQATVTTMIVQVVNSENVRATCSDANSLSRYLLIGFYIYLVTLSAFIPKLSLTSAPYIQLCQNISSSHTNEYITLLAVDTIVTNHQHHGRHSASRRVYSGKVSSYSLSDVYSVLTFHSSTAVLDRPNPIVTDAGLLAAFDNTPVDADEYA